MYNFYLLSIVAGAYNAPLQIYYCTTKTEIWTYLEKLYCRCYCAATARHQRDYCSSPLSFRASSMRVSQAHCRWGHRH